MKVLLGNAFYGEALQIDRTIGRHLLKFRTDRGYSQDSVAHFLGVSNYAVAGFESGRKRVKAYQLFQLARLLNVRVAAFFEQSGS